MSAGALERVRRLCLSFPETSERLSHDHPTFFIRGKKTFVMYTDHEYPALWCAAPEGAQDMLVGAAPENYFVPPYVGHRGWLGVRLDRGIEWDELAGVIEDAYLEIAPKKLAEQALAAGSPRPEN